MDITGFMAAVGTIILIASIVIAVLVSVLLLIVSIKPDFLNNWKSPGGSSDAEVKTTDTQDATSK
ncbi:MAG: hypothetical protein L0H59_18635 [Tomitella sp.]|nr:hypothetical protein [Tomitella sp.]